MSKHTIRLTLGIGLNGHRDEESDLEDLSGLTEAELDALSKEDLETLLDEVWKAWAFNYIDGCVRIVE